MKVDGWSMQSLAKRLLPSAKKERVDWCFPFEPLPIGKGVTRAGIATETATVIWRNDARVFVIMKLVQCV